MSKLHEIDQDYIVGLSTEDINTRFTIVASFVSKNSEYDIAYVYVKISCLKLESGVLMATVYPSYGDGCIIVRFDELAFYHRGPVKG